MFEDASLFPRAASTAAGRIDGLYFFLLGMAGLASAGIFSALILFSIRYRRGRGHAAEQMEGSNALEILWSSVPLVLWVGVFGWGAKLYLELGTRPADAMELFVTGKQWMWKIQHPSGQREINELHVPVGRAVVLRMISEDVIHSFYVPAFRLKQDVRPGSYSSLWFEANRVGTYHLFCAEYCGTKHSEMIGRVIAMEPADYERWLAGQPADEDPIEAGRVLFENLRCVTCHAAGSGQRGPDLAGRFGAPAALANGDSVPFDADYVRESVLEPAAKVSAGFQPVMPTYRGQVSEGQIHDLIAYIQSLATKAEEEP